MGENFDGWTKKELENKGVAYSGRNMITVHMRKKVFDLVFKWKHKIISERYGEIEMAYIDYITLKINLTRNIFRVQGYKIRKNLETGEVLGEDLVPEDWPNDSSKKN